MRELPIVEGWHEYVKEEIRKLEARARAGELFATLALPGWRQELITITRSENYYDNRSHLYDERARRPRNGRE